MQFPRKPAQVSQSFALRSRRSFPAASGTQSFVCSMGGQVERLHDQADVLRVDYTAEGIEIEVNCDEAIYGSLQRYEVT